VSVYAFSVWLHVVAAATWVGSMIFFTAVAVPVLRRKELRDAAPGLMRLLGVRFRVLGWIALGILVATGATNLYFRGVGWSLLFNRVFWSTPFGSALGWKLVFVAFVVVATAAHDVLAGRNALAALEREPSSPQGVRARRIASWLGRAVLLASLAILFFATALVRGFL
jgi:putative copper resistance protein D